MISISKVEELTPQVVQEEILRLLRAEAKILHSKGIRLLENFTFTFSDEELLQGPIGRKMKQVFDHVRSNKHQDSTEVHQYCIQIIEFIWPSQFSSHYAIPDSFWDTPMGFAVYEVVGKIENAPQNKELSAVQAAKYMGITLPELKEMVQKGKLKAHRQEGQKDRYLVRDLEEAKKK